MADMFREIGTAGIPQWGGRLEERYLPSLRGAAGIEKMAAILRKEPAAFTAHRLVLLSAAPATWKAVPASDTGPDREAADFLDSCLADMSHSFWEAVKFALSAQAFGFADHEIVWKRRQGREQGNQAGSAFDDGLVGIRKLAVRRQETVDRWETDANGGYQTMVQRDPSNYREIKVPIVKLLHFIGGDDRGSWEGLGWLEPAYKMAHQLDNYEIIQGVGWQRSFTGLPVFRWKESPDPNDIREAKSIGEGLAVNEMQYVALPGTMVDFELVSVANVNAGELRALINQLRWEIMGLVAVTFMRLGSTESGSRALSQPLIELYTRGVDASLDMVSEVLNRHMIPRLFDANPGQFTGMTDYPQITHSSITKLPLEALSYLGSLQTFLATAGPEDSIWLRELVGMPEIDLDAQQAEEPPQPEQGQPEDSQPEPEPEPVDTGEEGDAPMSEAERAEMRFAAAQYEQAAQLLAQVVAHAD
jgi:hypothetical protein